MIRTIQASCVEFAGTGSGSGVALVVALISPALGVVLYRGSINVLFRVKSRAWSSTRPNALQ